MEYHGEEIVAGVEIWADEMADEPERDEPEELTSEQLGEPDTGWEPYDDRPEQTHWIDGSPIIDDDEREEPQWIHPIGGPGLPYGGTIPPKVRRDRWYDLDAATAASLMVLGALAVPVAGVALWVGRRFRVVRR